MSRGAKSYRTISPRKPGGSCSYVSHHYKSQCSQVYNYHRLLSWDQERGLHMDIYKVGIGGAGQDYIPPNRSLPAAPATSWDTAMSTHLSRKELSNPLQFMALLHQDLPS